MDFSSVSKSYPLCVYVYTEMDNNGGDYLDKMPRAEIESESNPESFASLSLLIWLMNSPFHPFNCDRT